MIGTQKKSTTSGKRSHNFGTSSYINKYMETLQPVIEDIRMIHKSIWECCGRIGHKADSWITREPKFLPPSIKRNMNISTPFMVKNQTTHQNSGKDNLQNINSNPGPLTPKPVLWFQLLWRDWIITPLVMVILRFTLHIFQLNLTLNLF